jgi:hypothetical protein
MSGLSTFFEHFHLTLKLALWGLPPETITLAFSIMFGVIVAYIIRVEDEGESDKFKISDWRRGSIVILLLIFYAAFFIWRIGYLDYLIDIKLMVWEEDWFQLILEVGVGVAITGLIIIGLCGRNFMAHGVLITWVVFLGLVFASPFIWGFEITIITFIDVGIIVLIFIIPRFMRKI